MIGGPSDQRLLFAKQQVAHNDLVSALHTSGHHGAHFREPLLYGDLPFLMTNAKIKYPKQKHTLANSVLPKLFGLQNSTFLGKKLQCLLAESIYTLTTLENKMR